MQVQTKYSESFIFDNALFQKEHHKKDQGIFHILHNVICPSNKNHPATKTLIEQIPKTSKMKNPKIERTPRNTENEETKIGRKPQKHRKRRIPKTVNKKPEKTVNKKTKKL